MGKIYDPYNPNDTTVVAQIDGRLYYYDACSEFRDTYNPAVFDYIGQGVIHSCRGKLQSRDDKKFFWRRKERTLLQPEANVV